MTSDGHPSPTRRQSAMEAALMTSPSLAGTTLAAEVRAMRGAQARSALPTVQYPSTGAQGREVGGGADELSSRMIASVGSLLVPGRSKYGRSRLARRRHA